MSRVWPFSGDVCRRLGAYLSRFWEVISYTMFYPKLHHTRSLINLMTENLEKNQNIFWVWKWLRFFVLTALAKKDDLSASVYFPWNIPLCWSLHPLFLMFILMSSQFSIQLSVWGPQDGAGCLKQILDDTIRSMCVCGRGMCKHANMWERKK